MNTCIKCDSMVWRWTIVDMQWTLNNDWKLSPKSCLVNPQIEKSFKHFSFTSTCHFSLFSHIIFFIKMWNDACQSLCRMFVLQNAKEWKLKFKQVKRMMKKIKKKKRKRKKKMLEGKNWIRQKNALSRLRCCLFAIQRHFPPNSLFRFYTNLSVIDTISVDIRWNDTINDHGRRWRLEDVLRLL